MRLLLILLTLALTFPICAATPPAAQLLPADTLLLISVPDWDKATGTWNDSAYGRLWQDPSMKAFKEHALQKLQGDFASPVQRQLGIKWTDYLNLLHGQVSFAVIQNGWGTRPDATPALVLLVDCKDQQDALKARLTELKKKWVDAGKPIKTERIRDLEVTTFIVPAAASTKAKAPGAEDDKDPDDLALDPVSTKPEAPSEITFGQSGSLLIVASSPKEIENVLARHTGSLAASLAEQAAFDTNQSALFRDAAAFAWLNATRIYEVLAKQAAAAPKPGVGGNPFSVSGDRILAATGLAGLKTIAARLTGNGEGLSAEVVLTSPGSRRDGLLRLFALQPKEASPPSFVGADVVKFSRWRIDGRKAWTTLENVLTSISPEFAGLLQMGFQAAGKDRDPNFDLRKTLVGNLGDDFIVLQKNPRSSSLTDLGAPPTLYLLGSANPDQLVQGLKAATGLMPLAGGEPDLREREFLGRKIYSLSLPAPAGGDETRSTPVHQFSFAAGGGYAVMSADPAFLEEYLRSTEAAGKPLRDLPALAEAAQKVGGMSTGALGYENQLDTVRTWLESSQRESAALDKLLSLAPLAGGKVLTAQERKSMKEGLDLSLLPPFEKISKYFYFTLYSLGSSDDGLSWKLFVPTPPTLK